MYCIETVPFVNVMLFHLMTVPADRMRDVIWSNKGLTY